MIALMLAQVADAGRAQRAACEPVPAAVLHRWPLQVDGSDSMRNQPLSPAQGVWFVRKKGVNLTPGRIGPRVARLPEVNRGPIEGDQVRLDGSRSPRVFGHLSATDVPMPGQWTLAGQILVNDFVSTRVLTVTSPTDANPLRPTDPAEPRPDALTLDYACTTRDDSTLAGRARLRALTSSQETWTLRVGDAVATVSGGQCIATNRKRPKLAIDYDPKEPLPLDAQQQLVREGLLRHVSVSMKNGAIRLTVAGVEDVATLSSEARAEWEVVGQVPRDLRIGPLHSDQPGQNGRSAVFVDDVLLIGDQTPRPSNKLRIFGYCDAPVVEDFELHVPFTQVEFDLDGHYMGIAGAVQVPAKEKQERAALSGNPDDADTKNPFVARQRLVLRPTARVSENTDVLVQLRTLDPGRVSGTGALVKPLGTRANTLINTDVHIEQAYVNRQGGGRGVDFAFAGGRMPLHFGAGVSEQNRRGRLTQVTDPRQALFAIDEALQNRTYTMGSGSYGSTMDGVSLAGGYIDPNVTLAPKLQGFAGFRAGQRIPRCTSYEAPLCPDNPFPVYEWGLPIMLEVRYRDRLTARAKPWYGFLGFDFGQRWAIGNPTDAHFTDTAWYWRLAGLGQTAPTGGVWLRFTGELARTDPTRIGDGGDPGREIPLEFRGRGQYGMARLELAARRYSMFTLDAQYGFSDAVDGRDDRHKGALVSGMHPDHQVGVVMFRHAVATEAAQGARDGIGLPSYGGVMGARYVQGGLRVNVGFYAGLELGLYYLGGWSNEFAPGDIFHQGKLGDEFDLTFWINGGPWRSGFEIGWMEPGDAFPDDERVPRTAFELQLAREL